MKTAIILAIAAIALTGCAERRFAANAVENCTDWGYAPGTRAYQQCVQAEAASMRTAYYGRGGGYDPTAAGLLLLQGNSYQAPSPSIRCGRNGFYTVCQ